MDKVSITIKILILSLIHLIFLIRPHLFIPTLIFYVNGLFLSKNSINYLEIILLLLISSFAYVLNQIYDIESDKINKKIFILTEKKISISAAKTFSFLLLILSLFFSIFMENRWLFLGLIILSVFYSIKPFSFKDKPILDLITNSIGYGFFVFSIGYKEISKESLIFILIMSSSYLMTAIMDYEGDKKTNKITTPVFIGIYNSQLISILILIISFIIAPYGYIKLACISSLIFLFFDYYKLALAVPSLILLIYPSIKGYFEILILSIIFLLASEIYYRIFFKKSHFTI